jgi:hypothetical protein
MITGNGVKEGRYSPPPTITAILNLRSCLPSGVVVPASVLAPDLAPPGSHCTVRSSRPHLLTARF